MDEVTAIRPAQAQRGTVSLVFEIVGSLLTARRIRRGKKEIGMILPPVAEISRPPAAVIRNLSRRVRLTVFLLLFWKRDRCFYRSYAMAVILRKKGVPVELHLGCWIDWRNTGWASGHCWLTLDSLLFEERVDPRGDFPVALSCSEGPIHYWVGPAS